MSTLVHRFIGSVLVLACAVVELHAQNRIGAEDLARVEEAVRSAFATLYALPSVTSAAPMGSWVLDTGVTSPQGEPSGRWRILVTRLIDTGRDLPLTDLLRDGGASPVQLAASIAAMQRLEGKISKAEADAMLEVIVTLNQPELTISGVSDDADRSKAAIAGAQVATRIKGDWVRMDDRELEVDYERWSPATLLVGFGGFTPLETKRATAKESLATFVARVRPASGASAIQTVGVTAQGSDEMIDRLIKDTRWSALSALIR